MLGFCFDFYGAGVYTMQLEENGRSNIIYNHSIRINNRWRIVFKWTDADPEHMVVTEYHSPVTLFRYKI